MLSQAELGRPEAMSAEASAEACEYRTAHPAMERMEPSTTPKLPAYGLSRRELRSQMHEMAADRVRLPQPRPTSTLAPRRSASTASFSVRPTPKVSVWSRVI